MEEADDITSVPVVPLHYADEIVWDLYTDIARFKFEMHNEEVVKSAMASFLGEAPKESIEGPSCVQGETVPRLVEERIK
ncbi:hypothetical protein WA026_019507 [Henosepilachna vigintioctopunctata]|uniref:Uncharacterized protein n=1 Tax=Henosepilachna vigintioctopunctata TaxID=420089 RepID=A0AAW1TML8_9CUCU